MRFSDDKHEEEEEEEGKNGQESFTNKIVLQENDSNEEIGHTQTHLRHFKRKEEKNSHQNNDFT